MRIFCSGSTQRYAILNFRPQKLVHMPAACPVSLANKLMCSLQTSFISYVTTSQKLQVVFEYNTIHNTPLCCGLGLGFTARQFSLGCILLAAAIIRAALLLREVREADGSFCQSEISCLPLIERWNLSRSDPERRPASFNCMFLSGQRLCRAAIFLGKVRKLLHLNHAAFICWRKLNFNTSVAYSAEKMHCGLFCPPRFVLW